MEILPVPEGRFYCGATVLMMLTGKPHVEVRRDVNKLRRKAGKKSHRRSIKTGWWVTKPWPLTAAVKGISQSHMDTLLKKYGFAPKRMKPPRQTLRTFSDDFQYLKKPVVIVTGNHYLILNEGVVYDTFKRKGAPVAEHPFVNTRVTEYWIINKKEEMKS